MALSSSSKENISLKKLVGKAHTSNANEPFNESKTTSLTLSTSSIFAETISTSPNSNSLYEITDDTVEYVRLVTSPLPESLVSGEYRAFKLSLPNEYSSHDNVVGLSQNQLAGTTPFVYNQDLHSSNGKLQLVPPSFSDSYEAKVYYEGGTSKGSGVRIPLLDDSSWYLDYFNGVLFQETPQYTEAAYDVNQAIIPGATYKINTIGNTTALQWQSLGLSSNITPESGVIFTAASSQPADVSGFGTGSVFKSKNPTHVEAYIYIGNMADTEISNGSVDLTTSSVGDLSDVDIAGIQDGQILKWDADAVGGAKFVPSADGGNGSAFEADTSTLWALDDNGNLYPHGIIDGTLDTGMFAIELSAGNIEFTSNNTTIDDIVNAIQNINAYTPSNRAQADISDTYWEFDVDGNIMPKDAG